MKIATNFAALAAAALLGGAGLFLASGGWADDAPETAVSKKGSVQVDAALASSTAPDTPRALETKARKAAGKRTVNGDYVSSKPVMEVAADEIVDGDAVSLGGNLHVRGEVKGEAVAVGGNVYVYRGAKVANEIVAVDGKVILEEGAEPGCKTQSVSIPFFNMKGFFRWMANNGMLDIEEKAGSGHVGRHRTTEPVIVGEEDWEAEGKDVTVAKAKLVSSDVRVRHGNLRVEGAVGGDARVIRGNATILGTVGGDVKTFHGSVTIEPGATVSGDVKAMRGAVTIHGVVGGDVKVFAGDVTLGPSARISGKIRVAGGKLTRDPGAQVAGGVKEAPFGPFGEWFQNWDFEPGEAPAAIKGLSMAGRLFLWLAGAMLVGLLMPGTIAGASRFLSQRTAASLGSGVAGWIALPIVTIALAITCIGLLLVPLVWVAWVAMVILGVYVAAHWLGVAILPGSASERTERSWSALLLGTLIITLVGFVPWIGFAVKWIGLATLGTGALLISRFGRRGPGDASRFGVHIQVDNPQPTN